MTNQTSATREAVNVIPESLFDQCWREYNALDFGSVERFHFWEDKPIAEMLAADGVIKGWTPREC